MNAGVLDSFIDLSTPLIADACVRLGVPLRVAPPGIRPVPAGARVAGRVLPARHYGSVDVFGDADGVLFVAAERVTEVLTTAETIWLTERDQARRIRAGETLRQQTRFDDYLARRVDDPDHARRSPAREHSSQRKGQSVIIGSSGDAPQVTDCVWWRSRTRSGCGTHGPAG